MPANCCVDEETLAKKRTYLAEERTELAWQRNRLSEMSVLLGTIGAGLILSRFYSEHWQFGAAISTIGAAWLSVVAYRYFTKKGGMRGNGGKD
ncbi:hypothetical protein COT29_04255 [Candidatus Micrarchaeota archaeon CG08_land_8_20_14_0_20_59_11]|nr:MAG: hypothetical protein COT29_04255 [Candidatus Micrarchaeota archaeon CG08_land_8_20_14_0_20_59_11]